MKLPANYLRIEQGSSEWLHARCGCVTASRIADVITKLKKGGYCAGRKAYKYEVLTEILTGSTFPHFVSPEMQFGTESEPLARTAYEMAKEVEVEKIGYVKHLTIARAGASPDGLVGDDGLVEIKVPKSSTHLEYMLSGEIPTEYAAQMMWQMACSGRQWVDFVSHDPWLPQEFGLFIKRLHRNDEIIAGMEAEVRLFLAEVEGMIDRLQAIAA